MVNREDFADEYNEYNQVAFESRLAAALEHEKFDDAKNIIDIIHIADLAGFLNRATIIQKEKTLALIDAQQISDLIIELDATVIPIVISIIGYSRTADVISNLDVDDAIYVLDSLDHEITQVLLSYLNDSKQKELKEMLAYPEDSAGRLMKKEFVSVPEYWTVGQTIEYIQKKEEIPEIFYEIFVTDPKFTPVGTVPLSILVAQKNNIVICDIMNKEVKSVRTDLEEDEVSYLFKKYGFVTMPVVNKNNRLVGMITLEDALEVIDKQAEENTMHMGGVHEDDVYLNVMDTIKSRFPWLFISLLTATVSSLVVNLFHATIQQAVILSAIMPIVAGISGNAGTQTMTVTVLSLANKDLTSLNIKRVVLKQITSCASNGLMIALIGGLILGVLYNNYILSVVFGLAVTVNFALAGFLGSVIPIFFNRLGFNPSIASPVFLTTLTDMLGFAIFLGLASKMLL